MPLVAQSFGKENEYRRVLITILSFYAHTSQAIPTFLFTDNPDWFTAYLEGLPVRYILLTPEKIKTMRGEIDFLHRMKIALIEEAFQLSDDSLFYADSDTFFVGDPMKIYAQVSHNKSFMHLWEYRFEHLKNMPLPGGATFRAFVDLIERQLFELPDGSHLRVSVTDSSWNAGVMVLHASHRQFIPLVYGLTDQFYPGTKNHASEQYAFSIVLQKNTSLMPCEEVIYHYWYQVKKKIVDVLFPDLVTGLKGLPLNQRLQKVKQLSSSLPKIFEKHVYTLKDNAVQCFNDNKYRQGYAWALKAFLKGAFRDRTFVKDTLYHTKRWVSGR